MRVEIPENPKSLLDLAAEILKHHTELGEKSPLNVIEKDNWTTEGPNVKLCLDKHNEAEDLKANMEKAYKDRDVMLEGIIKTVKASRDVLTGAYHDNMKRMSDWGFIVYESVKPTEKTNK